MTAGEEGRLPANPTRLWNAELALTHTTRTLLLADYPFIPDSGLNATVGRHTNKAARRPPRVLLRWASGAVLWVSEAAVMALCSTRLSMENRLPSRVWTLSATASVTEPS